jgi:hypothetical protein
MTNLNIVTNPSDEGDKATSRGEWTLSSHHYLLLLAWNSTSKLISQAIPTGAEPGKLELLLIPELRRRAYVPGTRARGSGRRNTGYHILPMRIQTTNSLGKISFARKKKNSIHSLQSFIYQ